MLKQNVIDALRQDLSATVNKGIPYNTTLQVSRYSGVERLRFPDARGAVFKYAAAPFVNEDIYLRHFAVNGVAVPELYAAELRHDTLGMVMEDLGDGIRRAGTGDIAAAAVRLHQLGPAPDTITWDAERLAGLPAVMDGQLFQLQAEGKYLDAADICDVLARLDGVAPGRCKGAERPPFGFCHGELRRTSIHITAHGPYVLDPAKAFHGPGLLDLATWQGFNDDEPDPGALRDLIGRYVMAGGHRDALVERGDLAPELWALAWHQLLAAHWTLTYAAEDETGPERPVDVIRRQVLAAAAILDPLDF